MFLSKRQNIVFLYSIYLYNKQGVFDNMQKIIKGVLVRCYFMD